MALICNISTYTFKYIRRMHFSFVEFATNSYENKRLLGAVLFTVPIDLCAFLSDYIYANQIESLRLWSCGPAREEVSKDPHYPQQNKLEFKIHCFKSNHDWVTLQFSIVVVSRLGSENHYPWEFNILLKTLTSWSQRDKTLPETVTFTDKKKIAYNYSDPGGTLEKLNNLKPLFSRIEELNISKKVKENADQTQ